MLTGLSMRAAPAPLDALREDLGSGRLAPTDHELAGELLLLTTAVRALVASPVVERAAVLDSPDAMAPTASQAAECWRALARLRSAPAAEGTDALVGLVLSLAVRLRAIGACRLAESTLASTWALRPTRGPERRIVAGHVLALQGDFARADGDLARAAQLYRRATRIGRAVGDAPLVARAARGCGAVAILHADRRLARRWWTLAVRAALAARTPAAIQQAEIGLRWASSTVPPPAALLDGLVGDPISAFMESASGRSRGRQQGDARFAAE